MEAIEKAGYTGKVVIGMDVAASGEGLAMLTVFLRRSPANLH